MAGVADLAARHHRLFTGDDARVAFLSFATHDSANHPRVDKVRAAAAALRARHPDLVADGEDLRAIGCDRHGVLPVGRQRPVVGAHGPSVAVDLGVTTADVEHRLDADGHAGTQAHALEVFHPDRTASRILGMGDVLSLIEKAEQVVDEKEARKLAKKIRKNVFTLQDFLDQLQNIKKMGSMEQLMGMVPGINKLKQLQDAPVPNEKEMLKTEAIILSMTKKERANYKIINASRRQRIAKGSGTSLQEVNRVLKSYTVMLKMMKKMQGKGVVTTGGKRRKRPKGLRR